MNEEPEPFYLIQDYKDEIEDAGVFLDESISTVVEAMSQDEAVEQSDIEAIRRSIAMMRTALEHVEQLLPAIEPEEEAHHE